VRRGCWEWLLGGATPGVMGGVAGAVFTSAEDGMIAVAYIMVVLPVIAIFMPIISLLRADRPCRSM